MSDSDEYRRGHAAGEIAERLDGHDRHFQAINGSLEKIAARLAELNLGVQRLHDQAIARDATVVTTAAALKDAEDARRIISERGWSPVAKLLTVFGSILALAGVAIAYYVATRH